MKKILILIVIIIVVLVVGTLCYSNQSTQRKKSLLQVHL
jgi:uncharacterized protein YxeA